MREREVRFPQKLVSEGKVWEDFKQKEEELEGLRVDVREREVRFPEKLVS